MQVLRYTETDAEMWDEFISQAPMSTFLHTRRFLSYHGNRFRDASLLLMDQHNRLAGVLPAAVDKGNERRVVSHPGITYGGWLHRGELLGECMLEALQVACSFYLEEGFETLKYKAVPHIYHRSPSGDDIYSLFRINAVRYRCDLSCAIDLDQRGEVSQRRRRGVRKALKSGIEIVEGPELMAAFWEVLTDNLARKYQLQPVHSVNEISLLHSRFPDQIEFVAARLESEIVAGVVLFNSPRVVHAQYTASSQAGYDSCALDAVFEYCIEKAKLRGARYFDFGNSNEDEGRSLNSGLYRFKTEFGAGGVVHEFYEINLKS